MSEKALHSGNRKRFTNLLKPLSIAVFNSNDILPTNADGTMRFRQNTDIFWLTGINQEDTSLIIFPGHPDPELREILFVKFVDDKFVKWHGDRLSKDDATKISGIKNIKWHHEFEQTVGSLIPHSQHVFLNSNEHPKAERIVQTRDDRFIQWCKVRFPLQNYHRSAPLLADLRATKTAEEIRRIKEACRITELGFRRVLRFIKPGVSEHQVEAELIHEYLQHNSYWADYEPIIASGKNACILHYNTKHNICKKGELLLIDAAASWKMYNADLTRTIPVDGRFSKRQREVYNAVLRVHKAVKTFVKPGLTLLKIQEFTNNLLIEELLALKLFGKAELKEKGKAHFLNLYAYHGFGHQIGLDVHDTGNRYAEIPKNAVITIEPGIYIHKESIGIRLENIVQLTASKTVDLMATIPIEPDEIEMMMNSH
ncbi:MAG: aminopeptidase P N-terminal domain-containing protein [Bacteroidetes bacterium]|nr:aminopeptidase P N-terminal domain-containing protein [Bacteroidota bacterium]